MHVLYVVEICTPRTTFLHFIVWVYLHSLTHSDLRKRYIGLAHSVSVLRGHPNWYQLKAHMRLPISLLPFHYNDLLVQNVRFSLFLHVCLIWCPRKRVSLRPQHESRSQKTVPGLPDVQQLVLTHCQHATDRQTDRGTDGQALGRRCSPLSQAVLLIHHINNVYVMQYIGPIELF